jgi:hypothetical protein
MNTLQEAPYNDSPEDLMIVIVIRGTKIVTVAKKNEAKYQEVIDRVRYYADPGVSFKVRGQASHGLGYAVQDFQDFTKSCPTPSANWRTGSSRAMR